MPCAITSAPASKAMRCDSNELAWTIIRRFASRRRLADAREDFAASGTGRLWSAANPRSMKVFTHTAPDLLTRATSASGVWSSGLYFEGMASGCFVS